MLARLFGGIFGNSAGAGMAVAIAKLAEGIALFSAVGVTISLMGYAFSVLRKIED